MRDDQSGPSTPEGGVNLLYRASESFDGFQGRIVRRLANAEEINRVVVVSRSDDIPTDLANVVEYKSEVGWFYQYRHTEEYRAAEPLPREILESLQPYLATAIVMAHRDTNFDIYTAQEARRLVYVTLRYWHHVIRVNRVNYMLFSYVPHTLHEYAIYMLGKAVGVGMTVYSSTHIPYISVWGQDIGSVGDSIEETYGLCPEGPVSNGRLASYLEAVRGRKVEAARPPSQVRSARRRAKVELDRFLKPRNVAAQCYHCLRRSGGGVLNAQHAKAYGKRYAKDLRRSVAAFAKQRRVGYYDKRAVEPDYSKKFIYFGLQLTPEATTLPMAGAFDDQLLSVSILAEAARECGVSVYVKEHYVQPRRERYFYDELFGIDNVTCIKTSVPSMPLIESSIAVSTQTGSCILEGFIKGKPSLVFGECYYWKGMPGLYRVGSVRQCKEAIESILAGGPAADASSVVDGYFSAIDKNSIAYVSYVGQLSEEDRASLDVGGMADAAYESFLGNIRMNFRGEPAWSLGRRALGSDGDEVGLS